MNGDGRRTGLVNTVRLGLGRSLVTVFDLVTGGSADPGPRSGLMKALAATQTGITFGVVMLGLWMLWFAGSRVYLLALCLLSILAYFLLLVGTLTRDALQSRASSTRPRALGAERECGHGCCELVPPEDPGDRTPEAG